MKYLIWIIGLGIIGGTIYFTFFERSEYLPQNTNQTEDEDGITSQTPAPDSEDPSDVDEMIVNDDLDATKDDDNLEETPPEVIGTLPIDDRLRTFMNDRYGFAFDFNRNYYWDATKNDFSIDITNSKGVSEFGYQGYLQDNETAFRVDFMAKNIGSKSLEAYASENLPINDPNREVATSDFKAQGITGKEYFISKSSSPGTDSTARYEARFVLFKEGRYIYKFTTDGNDAMRDEIISSFRTI